jgi:hypothetical protein
MTTRALLITEGVHDVAFLGKLLDIDFGLQRIRTMEVLDPGWQKFLSSFKWPATPHKEGGKTDIARLSVPAPVFFGKEGISVAISNAQGIEKLVQRADADLFALNRDHTTIDAVGFLLDSDQDDPIQRFDELAPKVADIGLPRPQALGEVAGDPRTGIFVMPDSVSSGTLEDLLLACARTSYPALLKEAEALVARREQLLSDLNPREKKEIAAPAGANKATAAIVAAFLKPGKAIQASIEDHRWICEETIGLPELSPLREFLMTLLKP